MKFMRITGHYPRYMKGFFLSHPELKGQSYKTIKDALNYDGFGLADSWPHALQNMGYECSEIIFNCWPLQKTWALENNLEEFIKGTENLPADPPLEVLHRVALAQVKKFKPDVVFFQHSDHPLLKKIKEQNPNIRLFLGWTGSAIFHHKIVSEVDVMLSCSPETVTQLNELGAKTHHLDHAFERRLLERMQPKKFDIDFSFTGQIQHSKDFHIQRGQLLEKVAKNLPLHVFTETKNITRRHQLRQTIKIANTAVLKFTEQLGLSSRWATESTKIKRYFATENEFAAGVAPRLNFKHLHPPVFGLEMFQLLKDSGISLNIHADSSPRFASNIRLFEATGMGGCLLTDWKENIDELFVDGKEVVTYKSAQECIEKAKWLLSHPEERKAIGKAGQARALRQHTFGNRAPIMDKIIRSSL